MVCRQMHLICAVEVCLSARAYDLLPVGPGLPWGFPVTNYLFTYSRYLHDDGLASSSLYGVSTDMHACVYT